MLKRIIALLPLMTVAVTSYAGDDKVKLAYRNNDLPLQKKNSPILPAVTEKQEYYDIKGGCEIELRNQLRRNGTRWKDGKKYDSVTRWQVKWDFGPDRVAGTCTADSFRVNVDIRTRYPRWIPSDEAPQQLVEKWNQYLQNLATHENGHRDMVVEAAADLSRAVADLPPGLSCDDLYRKACDVCCERMQKLKKDEQEYDDFTSHGVMQGAVFP